MLDSDKGDSGEGETHSSRCPLNIKAPWGIIRHLSSCCLIVPSYRIEDVFALCFSKVWPFPKQFSVMTTRVHFNVFANEFPWYWKKYHFSFVMSPLHSPNRGVHISFCQFVCFCCFVFQSQRSLLSEVIKLLQIYKTPSQQIFQ